MLTEMQKVNKAYKDLDMVLKQARWEYEKYPVSDA